MLADQTSFPVLGECASTPAFVAMITRPSASSGACSPGLVTGTDQTVPSPDCDRATSAFWFSTRYTFEPSALIRLYGVVAWNAVCAPVFALNAYTPDAYGNLVVSAPFW